MRSGKDVSRTTKNKAAVTPHLSDLMLKIDLNEKAYLRGALFQFPVQVPSRATTSQAQIFMDD